MKVHQVLCYLFILSFLIIGCGLDQGIIEPGSNSDWWRNDPLFADRKVDEEATSKLQALGLDIVVMEGVALTGAEAQKQIVDQLGENYLHLLVHHTEEVKTFFQARDRINKPQPGDICPCLDFDAGDPLPPHCEDDWDGGGTGGGPPPPPPTFSGISIYEEITSVIVEFKSSTHSSET